MIKKIFQLLIFIAISYQLSAISSYAATVDKIIVVVNGETITQAELDAALDAVAEKLKKESGDEDISQKLHKYRKDILDRMIEEKLILSDAKKRDIKVEDAEIEAKLKEVKSKFGSDEKFNEILREEDVSLNELKQRYADQIRTSKLIDMEVRRKVVITPSELLQYYEDNKEKFRVPEQIKVKNILIKPEGENDDEKAGALAEKILGFLKAGESFDELALKYSKGPNADMGGDIGFVKRGQMIKPIEDVIFNLAAGQLSDVVKTDLGYHIFKIEERKAETIKDLNEVKDEIEKTLYYEKGNELYKKWVEDLKKNAYISYR